MKIASLGKRIGVSVIGSFLVAAISFLTSVFLARAFSASDFGLYQYMLSVGQSIVLIAGLNLGNAYFTFISKSPRRLSYHLIFSAVQVVLASFAILVVVSLLRNYLFESFELIFILICFAGSFGFFFLRQQVIYLLESQRRNELLQFLLVMAALLNLLVLFIASEANLLQISYVFLIMGIEYLVIWAFCLFYYRPAGSEYEVKVIWSAERASYIRYVKPLVLSLIVVHLCIIFDRWILQVNAGSIEQGYFGIAMRIATIATIISASIVNIFWKEVSALINDNKRKEALDLLVRWHGHASFIVFFGCLYIFINAERILSLTYGLDYVESAQALKIMAFYPMLQTSVHLLSTFLYASESTYYVARASIVTSLIGALVIWSLFTFNFDFTGSIILSYKYIIVSVLLSLMLSSSLGVLNKIWSSIKYLPIIFGIIFISFLFENWLESSNLRLVSHLIANAFFMGLTYLIFIGSKRYVAS